MERDVPCVPNVMQKAIMEACFPQHNEHENQDNSKNEPGDANPRYTPSFCMLDCEVEG